MTNKLILGTVQFGLNYGINNIIGKPSFDQSSSILSEAFDSGITHLDTAEAYGDSQEVIGNYHKKSTNRFQIITKYSPSRTDLSADIAKRIENNIKTLNVDFLYCYMFHSFKDYSQNYPRFKNEIIELKKAGLIQNFGVSVYDNSEIEELLLCEELDLIQLPFNMLDNSKQRSEILLKAKEKGVKIHTRSVFLQGLFFKDGSTFSSNLKPLLKYCESLEKIGKEYGVDKLPMALNYVYSKPFIDNVLIGVDTVEQLRENLDAINSIVSTPVFSMIDKIDVKEKNLLNPSNWNL